MAEVIFTPSKSGRTFPDFTGGIPPQLFIKFDRERNTVDVKSDLQVCLNPEEPGLIHLVSGLNDKTLLALARHTASMIGTVPWSDIKIRMGRVVDNIREVMQTVRRISRDDLSWEFLLRAAGESGITDDMSEGDRYVNFLEGMLTATDAAANKRHLPFRVFPGLELDMHRMLVHWARYHLQEISTPSIFHPIRSVIAREAIDYGLWKARNEVSGFPSRMTVPQQLDLPGLESERRLSAADSLDGKRLPGGKRRPRNPKMKEKDLNGDSMPSGLLGEEPAKKKRKAKVRTEEEIASRRALEAFFT